MSMIKSVIGIERADENLIEMLIESGALYTDETGLHCNKPGAYRLKGETEHADGA